MQKAYKVAKETRDWLPLIGISRRTLKKLNETEEKERLAEYGASLTILIIILVGLFVFTYDLIWSLAYGPENYYLNNIKNGRKLY